MDTTLFKTHRREAEYIRHCTAQILDDDEPLDRKNCLIQEELDDSTRAPPSWDLYPEYRPKKVGLKPVDEEDMCLSPGLTSYNYIETDTESDEPNP